MQLTGVVNAANATFNYAPGLFQWSGGSIEGNLTNAGPMTWSNGTLVGNMTNTGTITLAGGNDLTNCPGVRGQLSNAGTIIHQTGGLALITTDNIPVAGSVVNLPGGVYDFQGDGVVGVRYSHGNNPPPEFDNRGTLRKSAGTGTAMIGPAIIFTFPMRFDNSGTVDLRSGTLTIGTAQTTVAQVSGNILTGGNWDVLAGCTLDIFGANINTNQANVTLSGPGATFASIANLASNIGSFSVLAGATFTTAGALTNTGTLLVDLNSTLQVKGAFTQSATGAVEVNVAGTSNGQFGQTTVSGAANLSGTLTAAFVGGFTPVAGQSFKVMTYGSHQGTFSQIVAQGLPQGLALTAQYDPALIVTVN